MSGETAVPPRSVLRWGAVAVGVLVFLIDWSGFDKMQPDRSSRRRSAISGGICRSTSVSRWRSPGSSNGRSESVRAEDSGPHEPSRTSRRLRNALVVCALDLAIGDLFLVPWLGWRAIGRLDCLAALLMTGAVIVD